MANQTKSNHFSPKFSNEYWALNGAIKRIYRSTDGGIFSGNTSTRDWGCENYLYRQEVEEAYGKLGTAIAPI